jgi:hypothetical protein
MNNKKLMVLAGILAVSVLIIVLVNTLGKGPSSPKALSFFPGLTEKTIGAVLIKDAADQVKLQKKGDAWFMIPKQVLQSSPAAQGSGLTKAMGADTAAPKPVEGLSAGEYPADSATTASLVDGLLKLNKDILVSENPSKQATFEVDSIKGIRIEVFDLAGRSLGAVLAGKNGSDWSSNYFRAEGSDAVYQVQNVNRYVFGSDHKRWTDKSVMKFDKATARQITVGKKGAPALLLVKADSINKLDTLNKADTTAKGGWYVLSPVKKPADQGKVDEMLSALSNLMAAEYEDSIYTDSTTGLNDPAIKVTVGFASGTVRTLDIGNLKTGANKYWMRVPEKSFVFLMNDYDQKKFDKKPEDLAKQPLKPIEAVPAPIPAGKLKKKS